MPKLACDKEVVVGNYRDMGLVFKSLMSQLETVGMVKYMGVCKVVWGVVACPQF